MAVILGIVDFSPVGEASFFSMPKFVLPFKDYSLNFGALVTVAPVALVTLCEHIGDHTSLGNIIGKDLIKDPGLDRTLLGDGIATFVDMTPGTTYRILEIEAPKGYELANVDNSAVIKLDRKGYAKGSATIINQTKKLEGSTAQAELIIEIQTGRKLIRYGLIIAGTLILIAGLMITLIYVSKKRK